MSRMPTAGPQWGQTIQVASAVARLTPGYEAPQWVQVNSVTQPAISHSPFRISECIPLGIVKPELGGQVIIMNIINHGVATSTMNNDQ